MKSRIGWRLAWGTVMTQYPHRALPGGRWRPSERITSMRTSQVVSAELLFDQGKKYPGRSPPPIGVGSGFGSVVAR